MQKQVIWLYRGQPHLLPLQIVLSEMEPRYCAVQLQRCAQQPGRRGPCREGGFICCGQDSDSSHKVPHKRDWYLHSIIFPAEYSTISPTRTHMLFPPSGPLHINLPLRNTHDAHAPHSTSVNKHNVSTNFCSSLLSHIYLYTPQTHFQTLSQPTVPFILALLSYRHREEFMH